MPIVNGADPSAIELAAQGLAAGELVAFPTETVYGLGARADDDGAVARIYAAKGRPVGHPLIVHVADHQAALDFCARHLGDASPCWPATAEALAAAFWPGPLTLIVPRRPGFAAAAAGGQGTIGLRQPSHPVALALLKAAQRLGVPGVAAPSANRFGRISPTTAAHVVAEFGTALVVLDGGACDVGIESAIVDCTASPPALLRPGQLIRADIEAALGLRLGAATAGSPRASGTLAAHYAPVARLRLLPTRELMDQLAQATAEGRAQGLAVYSRAAPPSGSAWLHRPMPADAQAVAHELFAVLRSFDAQDATAIWVEQPPNGSEWDGVRDRLQRAAS